MKNFKTLFAISIFILIAACSKDSDAPIPPAATANLLITNISPTTGPKNTAVTITGTGFSTTTASNAVTINGKVCPIINTTSTQLTVTIPPSAGSGKLKVTVGAANTESNNFDFVVTTTVSTFAGSSQGSQDGQSLNAQFNSPSDVAIDATGNLFIVDFGNNRIRKQSPTGLVSTIAGSNAGNFDGQGINAKFNGPRYIAVDISGNLFITDVLNNKIRKISPTGLVSTFAGNTRGFTDGQGINAQFREPIGVTIDNVGNLFVTDLSNRKIRKISQTAFVSTIAGSTSGFADGQGLAAQFNSPRGIAIDATGNLFVVDNVKIRKISATGLVSTLAGSSTGFADGQGAAAQFNDPEGITIDNTGNLFVCDTNNHSIRKISPTGLVTTIAGSTAGFNNGNATTAQFHNPSGIAVDTKGDLYVADGSNNKIRKITFD